MEVLLYALAGALATGGTAAAKRVWDKADGIKRERVAREKARLEEILLEIEKTRDNTRKQAQDEGLEPEVIDGIRAIADGDVSPRKLRKLIEWLESGGEGPPPLPA